MRVWEGGCGAGVGAPHNENLTAAIDNAAIRIHF